MNVWTDPHAWHWLGKAFTANFVREGLYYLVAALLLWLVVHHWLHKRLAHRVIEGWPTSTDVRREMAYSFSTLFIFSAQGLILTPCQPPTFSTSTAFAHPPRRPRHA